MNRFNFSILILLAFASIAFSKPLNLENILPSNTMVYGRINSLKDIKDVPVFKEISKEIISDEFILSLIYGSKENMNEFVSPTEMIAWALYSTRDEETGAFNAASLMAIDMGDSLEVSMNSLVEHMNFEEIKVGGHKAFLYNADSISSNSMAGFGFDPMSMLEMDFSKVVLVPIENYLFLSNDLEGVVDVVNSFKNESFNSSSLAQQDAFKYLNSVNKKGNIEVILILDGIADFMMRSPMAMYAGMMMPALKSAFGKANGVGLSIDLSY